MNMNKMMRYLSFVWLLGLSSAFAQFEGLTVATDESVAVRLDLRDGFGGRVVQGVVVLSAEEGTVKCDGKAISSSWNTTALADGWHTLSCNGKTEQVCVRNDTTVALEEGRLAASVVWDASKVHVIRNDVYVPNGVTLTITQGAVVKFAEDSLIIVEHGGKLNVNGTDALPVQFALVTDDGIGGNTDMWEAMMETPDFSLIYCYDTNGFFDNSHLVLHNLHLIDGWPTVDLHNAMVFEAEGTVWIGATVSGARNTAFWVDWEAVDGTAKYGSDYSSRSGRITWSNISEGTKYIEIPLVTDNVKENDETFTVRITRCGGVNAVNTEATVVICDNPDNVFGSLTCANGVSETIRLDMRDDFGGRAVQGVVALSAENGVVKCDGKVVGMSWDTTKLVDGWHTLSCDGKTEQVCVRNDSSIQLEEGRLAASVVWDSSKIHVIRNDVYVPNGVTLTIIEGTVVKFAEDSLIIVEHGGKMVVNGTDALPVQFAFVTDDGVGGNTDMRDATMEIPDFLLIYCYDTNGFIDNSYLVLNDLQLLEGWPTVELHNAMVFEDEGTVWIGATVSGTRNNTFWVEWEAVDGTATYGNDYTVKSGRLTWSKISDGTKYIEIPLVQDNKTEGRENFTIRIIRVGGISAAVDHATVEIDEMSEDSLHSEADYSFASAESEHPVTVDGRILWSVQPLKNIEKITYSRDWWNGAGVAAKSQVLLFNDRDEADTDILAVADDVTSEGILEWNTSELPSGRYTLCHDTLDAQGKRLERLQAEFFLNRDTIVHDGMLTQDEVWGSEAIHIVSENVIVPYGVNLEIADGAVVKFMDGTSLIAQPGSGVSANRVVFTHLADDAVGGDTNLDGNATSPINDAYTLEGFTPSSDCELRYVTLTFEGGTIYDTKVLQGNRVHKVTGNITIASGGKLIVQPGAVVKMETGLSVTVNSGGALEALGTRAQPIVFTSIKDDAHGGDTNGDGNGTMPEEGDWIGVIVNGGTATFEYSIVQWAGWGQYSNQGDAILRCNSGQLKLKGCIVQNSLLRLIYASGNVEIENSMLQQARYGVQGNAVIKNSVIAYCAEYTLSGNGTLANSILYDTAASDGYRGQYCCLWKAGSLNGDSNIITNPLFKDPDNGDFTLQEGSPCIDAGDGTVAPELDYFGQPRQDIRDVENTGTAATNGAVPDIGIHEMLPRNAAADVDFVAVSVHGASAVRVGERFMVEWTIRNDGGEAAVGSWRDYVYLVAEDGAETLLGNLVTTGSVAPNGLRVLKMDFLVPDVDAGEYHLKLKCNMNRDIFEGTLTANNIVVSEETVVISYPKAAVKDGIRGSLAVGGSIVKLMAVEEGYSLALIQAPKGTKVYYSLGSIPTAESHISSVTCLDGTTMLSLPTGDVYLLVVAPDGEACDYRIDFTEDRLQISRLEPSSIMRNAVSHVLVHGSMFSSKAVVHLLRNGKDIELPGKVLDDDDILVTIEASELDAGDYDVKVVDYDGEATLKNALHVTNGTPVMNVRYALNMPDAVRTGRWFTVTLEYENTGNVEMPAPIFHLKSKGRNFDVAGTVHENEVWLYGIGSEYPNGWLKPGDVRKATFKMQMMANAEASVTISCASMASNDVGEALDLRGFFEEEWLLNKDAEDAEMLARLRTAVGTTKGDYRRNLANFYDTAGYGITEAVDFMTIQNDFFFNAFSVATSEQEVSEEIIDEQQRRTRGWDDLKCNLADPLTKGITEAVRYKDQYGQPGHIYGTLYQNTRFGDEFPDYAKDASRPGDLWFFHSFCGNWHRAVQEEVRGEILKAHGNGGSFYILCHGNACSIHEEWLFGMAREICKADTKACVLAVDWGDIALKHGVIGNGVNPETTTPQIPAVADEAMEQLEYVFGINLNDARFILLGHSHGAHLAGHIAKKLKTSGNTPKRFVGMDTSPMWTHRVDAKLKFPEAWDDSVAEKVEFYKTSWTFSMGEKNDEEIYGTPSFYVVGINKPLKTYLPWGWGILYGKDRFFRDIYTMDVEKLKSESKGFLDGAGIALDRHGYSHDWFTETIEKGGDFGWGWKDSNWSNQPVTSSEKILKKFCGVLYDDGKNTHMELGKECVDRLNDYIRKEQYGDKRRGEVDGKNWRYYSRVLGGQADQELGLDNFKALERLWNLHSLLVEYYADILSIPDTITADTVPEGDFIIRNFADNVSIDRPRRDSEAKLDYSYRERFPKQLPWKYNTSTSQLLPKGIRNALIVYDLSQMQDVRKTRLMNEINLPTQTLAKTLTDYDSDLKNVAFTLQEWDGFDNFITVEEGSKPLKISEKFQLPKWLLQIRGGLPAGCKGFDENDNDCFIPYSDEEGNEVGEPFLFVGMAAQVRKSGVYEEGIVSYEDYPGDLYLGDNCVAKIVYVKKSKGSATAICRELIASSGTRSVDLRGEEGETQDDYGWEFRTVTDANGNWSIRLSGDRSWTTNEGGLQFYYFTVPEEVGMYQKKIREPEVTLSGTLPEGCTARRYSIKLKVLDFIEVFGEVTVDIVVSRPQQCMCMDGGICNCDVCKCGERGATGPSSPQSCDPNEISGMYGVGDSGTQRFVKPGEELTYTIYFENKAEAEAAAQEVRVTSELSNWLDWSSFQIVEVGFNNQIDTGLAGKSDGMSEVVLDGTDWTVRTEVELDKQKGLLSCYLRIVDETTEDGWPEDPYAGFLPPNDSTHRGEGYVRYKVKVRDDAPDGAFVNAEATIVFDYNDPITTSPAWFNWVTREENPVADNSTLRWDTSDDPEGTTYVVNYWSGDPDPTAPGTTITFNSDALTTGSWKLPEGLFPATWYWNVTKTADGESWQTSTWSFDILASHTLTVHGGSGSGTYRTNTLVSAEANAMEGKTFTGWTATGIELSAAELADSKLVFYMPDNDVTLTANFKESYTVTVQNGLSDKLEASVGETVTITADVPADGMVFDKWTSDDVVFVDASSMRTSFTMPAKNVTVTATYCEQDGIILLPGWNLIAVPGDLPMDGNEALFADLKPFMLEQEANVYVQASLPISAGTPLWIFSDKRQIVRFNHDNSDSVIGGLTNKSGWHLIGVGGEEDVTLDHVLSVWQWSAGKWKQLEINEGKVLLKAGCGYFIYKE